MLMKMDREAFKEAMMAAKEKEKEETGAETTEKPENTTVEPKKRGRRKKAPESFIEEAMEKANDQEEAIKVALKIMEHEVEMNTAEAEALLDSADRIMKHMEVLRGML